MISIRIKISQKYAPLYSFQTLVRMTYTYLKFELVNLRGNHHCHNVVPKNECALAYIIFYDAFISYRYCQWQSITNKHLNCN